MSKPLNYFKFNSQVEQFAWITEKIHNLVAEGQNLNEVAVICRKHASLAELSKYLHQAHIPVYYERGQNVLEKPYIKQLLAMLKFVDTLSGQRFLEADEFLPEILSFPFWQLARKDIWLLSVYAYAQKEKDAKLWLDVMQKAEDVVVVGEKLLQPEKIKQIAEFFVLLAADAKALPVERVIDRLVGATEVGLPESEQEENIEPGAVHYSEGSLFEEQTENFGDADYSADLTGRDNILQTFKTNFKQYYFDNRLDLDVREITSESINFLSNLRTLISAIRQYRVRETLFVSDLVEFVNLLEKNKLPLIDNSPFGSQDKSVNLLTAHKAKGLEFEIVFVIDCLEKEWFGGRKSPKLSLPQNLPFLADKDDKDDQLRLFYVAITRAKYQVFFTTYEKEDNSSKNLSISFLEEALKKVSDFQESKPNFENAQKVADSLAAWNQAQQGADIVDSEKRLLQSILQDYKLSVTHFNNFLDVSAGGPRRFLEQNLLHFPQSKTTSAAYGTAMHAALRIFLEEYKLKREYPEKDLLIRSFIHSLGLERLSDKDFQDLSQIGSRNLEIYYDYKYGNLHLDAKMEFSFASQEVCVNQARLTGQIDLIEFDSPEKVLVTDFKTGKPLEKWQDGENKLKLWRYRNQLVFYKILVENSRTFGGKYKVDTGQLEFLDAHYLSSPKITCLQTPISTQEVVDLSKLIEIVFQKIINLDFPETAAYTSDFSGTNEFIQDLLAGRI